jgi:hypothetical protein
MKSINKSFVILLFFLIVTPSIFSFGGAEFGGDGQNIRTINIAQYPRTTGSDHSFDILFNYSWKSCDTTYKFTITELTLEEIKGGGKQPLTNDNFDLLVVGASFNSITKDGRDPRMEENIKEFLSNGGGYLSSCAGTTFASQGYEKPRRYYEKRINKCVLNIANVNLNLGLWEESQYIFKCSSFINASQGLVPIEKRVVRNNSNPIFSEYSLDTINMSYGGGPGLIPANAGDPNLGEITPLLVINEELMETKPIHRWRKMLIGWKKAKTVKTDIYGQYGGIATTYGEGRVVLFTAHAEIPLVVNGSIDEFVGRNTGYGFRRSPFKVVFTWIGTPINMSHNWWIHRRAAAWIAGVPDEDLPPCNELMVLMEKPQFRLGFQMYVDDVLQTSKSAEETVVEVGMTVIEGPITVEAYAENSDIVEFYIDGALEYTDTEPNDEDTFEWYLDKNLSEIHRLEIRAYDEYGNCVRDGSKFLFYNS